MNGLELAKCYWQEAALPLLTKQHSDMLPHMAVGLVGEGSECFGYDDEISRDHDWGPGFCMWFTEEDLAVWAEEAQEFYHALPRPFHGFQRVQSDPMSAGRVGVLAINSFYQRFLGVDHPPRSLKEWRVLPESGLATATNGAVFTDPVGAFSEIRQALLDYYPEDLRRKKLVMRCALAAQSGQYNVPRCQRRGDRVAALQALAQFIGHVQAIVFLLNRRYCPYYKWTQRALTELPVLGREIGTLLVALTEQVDEAAIEHICAKLIIELARQGLTEWEGSFLLDHARSIQAQIKDRELRQLHLMVG